MHGDLPSGTVVSASERRGGALYKVEPCRKVNTQIKGKKRGERKMGKAKLNIWARDKNCRIIERTGLVRIYNCQEEEVFHDWVIRDGHAEVEMPPGCYIVKAGCFAGLGNIYTDRTMVVVRCGDEACVNLILPNFVERVGARGNPQPVKRNLLAVGGCAPTILLAFGVNALKKNIDPEDAIDKFIEVAEIDRGQMIAAIETEIKEISANIDEVRKDEIREFEEYKKALEKIKEIISKKESPK